MDSLKNRITKEFEELNKNKEENAIEVWLVDNNIRHWKGKIKGPVRNLTNNLLILSNNRSILVIKAENSLLILLLLKNIHSSLLK